jgi:hypothetical protein
MALQRSAFFGPDVACPETHVTFDSEDGRLRSRKQTFSDSTRKDGLETWRSDSVPDSKNGTQALQPCSALAPSQPLSRVSYGASRQPWTCPMPPICSALAPSEPLTRVSYGAQRQPPTCPKPPICSALAPSEPLSRVSYGASRQPPACPMPPTCSALRLWCLCSLGVHHFICASFP